MFDLPRTAHIRLKLRRVALPTTNPGSKPMLCRLFVAALLSHILAIPVQAAITLGPSQQKLPLAGKLEILEDPSRKMTLEDAASPCGLDPLS
jgi:hypothetical protein